MMLALGVDHHLPPGPQTDMQGEMSAYMIGKVLGLCRKGKSSTPESYRPQLPAGMSSSGPARKLGLGKFIGGGGTVLPQGPWVTVPAFCWAGPH